MAGLYYGVGRKRMAMVVRRFQIWLVSLDPTVGNEIQKTRPCVIVSPDAVNKLQGCVLVAPMQSAIRPYPFRMPTTFKRRKGQISLDQIRAIDKSRLIKKVGALPEADARALCELLVDFFTYE